MKISLVSMPVQDPVTAHQIYTSNWGLENMFEDGCGNLLMIEESPA